MKTTERYKAVELRRKGLTYKEIKRLLGVSKNSLSRWLNKIPYVPTEKTKEKRRAASINNGQVLHQRKIQRIAQIKIAAKQDMPDIRSHELKLLGIMAYWAEGSKTQDGLVKFTNTDPEFIKFVLRWLRETCCVSDEKLHLHIRVHRDIDKEKAEKYWSEITKIPKKRFFKTTIKTSDSKGKRHNKVGSGIASVIVCDATLFHKIMGWIESLVHKIKL